MKKRKVWKDTLIDCSDEEVLELANIENVRSRKCADERIVGKTT